MRIVKPQVFVEKFDPVAIMKKIERIGRVCYKSEDAITDNSYEKFIRDKIALGHHSIIEHANLTVRFICDRGVTHEIVRHRLCAFSQESTRYCNYAKDKHGSGITVIEPFFFEPGSEAYFSWKNCCEEAERTYLWMIEQKRGPGEARDILPNSLKTEIVVTANVREWRHILTLRTAKTAHPQMRQIMIPTLRAFQEVMPPLYDDIDYDTSFPVEHYAEVAFE